MYIYTHIYLIPDVNDKTRNTHLSLENFSSLVPNTLGKTLGTEDAKKFTKFFI